MNLSELAIGQTAKIIAFSSGSDAYRRRLMAMGLTRGTVITVLRIAPLGCPVQLSVRGANVCLRQTEASLLQLELLCKN